MSGRLPQAEKSRDTFRREIDAIDEFLAEPRRPPTPYRRSCRRSARNLTAGRRQTVAARRRGAGRADSGEGGVRIASARFMRKLRLLTRIYDVPLIFDEVQTGWGMTGRLWAHELFDLPCPPDLVTWAKKAQNGVPVRQRGAGDVLPGREEVQHHVGRRFGRHGAAARVAGQAGSRAGAAHRRPGARRACRRWRATIREILKNVRGAGVMLGFDVLRADLCDALLDRAFRRGLRAAASRRAQRCGSIPATTPSRRRSTRRSSILRRAIEDLVGGRAAARRRASREGPCRHAGDPARYGR